jgi:hypothetical protein
MEPNREEQKVLEPGAEHKPKRFRIVKLEERIAPSKGGVPGTGTCLTAHPHCSYYTAWCGGGGH